MSSSAFVVARGQQVIGLLLSTVPLAERMLLYHVAMTAWIMLPERLGVPQRYGASPELSPGQVVEKSVF